MGTLVATGIMKSSEAIKSEDRIAAEDIPEMLKKAIVGIEQRGKAKRGDKTLLDALYPALEASEVAVSEGKSLRAIVEAAYSGSKTGVESTKQMKSTWGKAAVYGDKSIGKQDPGATAVMYVFEGIVNYFNGLSA
jgi:dihydroxyacetone kinase-like protein